MSLEYENTKAEEQARAGKFADMSFAEVAAIHGEEVAILAGIAADPDAAELGDDFFENARPASEAAPQIVRRYRARGKRKA